MISLWQWLPESSQIVSGETGAIELENLEMKKLVACVSMLACNIVVAQMPPEEAVEFAKGWLSVMDRPERCELAVLMTENRYVSAIDFQESPSRFRLGDHILSVTRKSVVGPGTTDGADIDPIPSPGEIVRVKVERDGKPKEFEVQCVSSRLTHEPAVRMLEAMERKEWDECFSAAEAVNYSNKYLMANARLTCGVYADKIPSTQVAAVAYDLWRITIEEDKWDPILWPSTRAKAVNSINALEQNGEPQLAADLESLLNAADRSVAVGEP